MDPRMMARRIVAACERRMRQLARAILGLAEVTE